MTRSNCSIRSASMSASCGSRATDSRNSVSALMKAASTEESSSTTSRCFTSFPAGSRAAANAGGRIFFFGRLVSRRVDLDPFVSPLGNRVDRRRQSPAFLRQRIFHANRCVGYDRALDDAFLFELLEALAQHAIGNVGNRVAKGGEAATRPGQNEK